MQDEVSAVRVLFELLGFLLAVSSQLSEAQFRSRGLPQGLKPKVNEALTARLEAAPFQSDPL
jgi:hypothetical protein